MIRHTERWAFVSQPADPTILNSGSVLGSKPWIETADDLSNAKGLRSTLRDNYMSNYRSPNYTQLM